MREGMLIVYPTGGKRTCISEARASHKGLPRWSFGQLEISMIRVAKSLLLLKAPGAHVARWFSNTTPQLHSECTNWEGQ